MIKVISGGQTGADQGGLDGARAAGAETGGWAPRGWMTEAGACLRLRDMGLLEHSSGRYPPRTRANVEDSDATVWFGSTMSRGHGCTLTAVTQMHRPIYYVLGNSVESEAVQLARWLVDKHVGVVNVAGNRESHSPGIYGRAYEVIRQTIQIMERRK